MKRTVERAAQADKLDLAPLIRVVQYLDAALKRGVVIGVYEDSREVSDEDVKKALAATQAAIDNTILDMERLARAITRIGNVQATGSIALQ